DVVVVPKKASSRRAPIDLSPQLARCRSSLFHCPPKRFPLSAAIELGIKLGEMELELSGGRRR
ncbi:oligopeptide transporter, partial [Moniliophthora roreri]